MPWCWHIIHNVRLFKHKKTNVLIQGGKKFSSNNLKTFSIIYLKVFWTLPTYTEPEAQCFNFFICQRHWEIAINFGLLLRDALEIFLRVFGHIYICLCQRQSNPSSDKTMNLYPKTPRKIKVQIFFKVVYVCSCVVRNSLWYFTSQVDGIYLHKFDLFCRIIFA